MNNPNKTSDWQPPENTKIIIVCAANKLGGTILIGARHCDDIMHSVARRIYGDSTKMFFTKSEQGFIDQFCRFYNRQDAYDIVQKNGQPFNAERNAIVGELYSEGLY